MAQVIVNADLCDLCIYPPTIFHNLSRDFFQISKKSSCSLLNIDSGDEKPVLFFFKSYLIGLVQDQLHPSYTKILSPRHP